MNILVIGNGFDLAHNLKTNYTDFIICLQTLSIIVNTDIEKRENKFREIVNELKKTKGKSTSASNEYSFFSPFFIQRLYVFFKNINKRKFAEREFEDLINTNFWFIYFQSKMEGKSWIDFEKEIKYVCEEIEKKYNETSPIFKMDENIYNEMFSSKDLNIITNKLQIHLDKFINAFNNYIYLYIDGNFQQKDLCYSKYRNLLVSPDIVHLNIDKLISFNYSDTYRRLYNSNIDIDYIHGKASSHIETEYSNLVLGYDVDNTSKISEFVEMQKYYQRVLKNTSNKYIEWNREIESNPNQLHNVYFFGHSLDITDKDIIKKLILHSNVHTIIYYWNDSDKRDKVKNLIRVIEYDDFLEYTGNGNIEFIKQCSMRLSNEYEEYNIKKYIKYLYHLPFISVKNYKELENWLQNDINHLIGVEKYFDYLCLIVDALDIWKIHCNIKDKLVIHIKNCKIDYNYDEFKKERLYYIRDKDYIAGICIKETLKESNHKFMLEDALSDLCGGCKKTNTKIINNKLGTIEQNDFKMIFRHLVKSLNNGMGNLQQKYDDMIKVCEVCNKEDLNKYFNLIVKEKKEYSYIVNYLKKCMMEN